MSHLQFCILALGFEWERVCKLQKRAMRIMTNSKYNAHTEPLFKHLNLLKIDDLFDVQCLKFWYKFKNNTLPYFFRDMFQYNYESLALNYTVSIANAMYIPLFCAMQTFAFY